MTVIDVYMGSGTENARWHNYLGLTIDPTTVNIGDYLFGAYSYYLARFQLPVYKYSTINSATINFYCIKTGNFGGDEIFDLILKVDDSDDAKGVAYGINRTYWATTVTYHIDNPPADSWVSIDIKTLVSHIITRSGWKKNNHIFIEFTHNASNEWISIGAYNYNTIPYLHIDYTLDTRSEDETLSLTDSFYSDFSNPSNEKIYLDDIELNINTIEIDRNFEYGYTDFTDRSLLPTDIALTDQVNYQQAYQLISLVGKNVPLWVLGDTYNVLVQGVETNYFQGYVDVSIKLKFTN